VLLQNNNVELIWQGNCTESSETVCLDLFVCMFGGVIYIELEVASQNI